MEIQESIIGKKFGLLTVLREGPKGKSGVKRYICLCECGRTSLTRANRLISGSSQACGEHKKIKIGQIFGSFTVIDFKRGLPKKPYAPYYQVECGKCSKQTWYRADYLKKKVPTCRCSYQPHNKGREGDSAYTNYQKNAVKRNLTFELSRELFYALIGKDCAYCGAPPRKYAMYTKPKNGIDRVDNNLGYTEKNSVPCCSQCNIAKRDRSQSDFIEWARRLYLHLSQTKQINNQN